MGLPIKKPLIMMMVYWLTAVSLNLAARSDYPLQVKEEVRFVPQKEVVEILSLDHRGFAADMLLIQAILHTGSLMWKPVSHQFDSEWSYQLMDTLTSIDPRYLTAYLFCGMGLVHGPKDVALARPLLERGMTYFPQNWELPFWIGYNYYVYFEDYEQAGEYFWRAAHCPGAPNSFLSLMLSSLNKGGHYERAILVLKSLIDSTDNERVIQIYQKRIERLENMVMLEKAAAHYAQSKGRGLTNINQLVSGGVIPFIPKDPMGKDYFWDAENNRVIIKD
jgi:tetratricopeptide (TPR) repeat protein